MSDLIERLRIPGNGHYSLDRLKAADRIEVLENYVVQLKGNHKGMVIKNAILRDRHDLPVDRINAYKRQQDKIDALEEKTQWKPIETAPKDGTRILMITLDCHITTGWWEEEEQDGVDEMGRDAGWRDESCDTFPGRSLGRHEYTYHARDQPTHWMKLPEPPK